MSKKNFTQNSKLGKLNFSAEPTKSTEQKEKKLKTLAVKIDSDIVDKLNDFVFWAPKNQSEVVEEVLSNFLNSQDISPIPEAVKEKQNRAKQKRREGMKK